MLLGALSAGLFSLVTLVAGQASTVAAAPSLLPPLPAPLATLPIRFYGFVKPTVVVSNGVETFNQSNQGAVVAAVNPAFVEDADAPAVSFQVGQSRAGVLLGEGLPIRAQLEVDFIHFDVASPTTGAYPRLRMANVEWEPVEGHKLFVGQGWDVFSPLNPHGFNPVGAQFLSGNVGFIRQQATWTSTLGGLEVVGGLGMPSTNNGAALTNAELGFLPSAVARISYRHEKMLWFGMSFLGALHRLTAPDRAEVRRATVAANAFGELVLGGMSVRTEVYAGQNTANAGMLSLGTGTMDKDLYDCGGYLSFRHALGEQHALQVTVGGAAVLNEQDMGPGYTAATATTKAARTGTGIDRNAQVRGGYAFSPMKGLQFFVEGFAFATRHKLATADLSRFAQDRTALGVESGAFLTF